MMYHLRTSFNDNNNLEEILEMINDLDIEDVLCPICMERMPFFAGCPDRCNISICVECAKQSTKCPICSKNYPQFMLNTIKITNPENTIIL